MRRTQGKEPIKKSTTIVNILGQGSAAAAKLQVISVPVRNLTGFVSTIIDDQDTGRKANVGNVIKYLNLCIQIGPRANQEGPEPDIDNNGWLEYALITQKELEQDMATAQLGTQTLGDVATKQYRGDCIFTGCIPVSAVTANSLDLKIKLPPKIQKLQQGSSINLYCAFRSVNSADLRSDSHKLVMSAIYKLYV